jgi:FlgD Ig-like domain
MPRYIPGYLALLLVHGIVGIVTAATTFGLAPAAEAVTTAGSSAPATLELSPIAGMIAGECPAPTIVTIVDEGRAVSQLAEQGVIPAGPPAAAGGTPCFFAGGEIASSPKPIRLDGDPRPGIVFGTSQGRIFILDADCAVLPGWPVTTGTMVGYTSAAVADIDGNGSEDIIFHANNAIEIYRQSGVPLAGWPRLLDSNIVGNSIIGSPTVADIDDNGDLEILVGHLQRMYAFHHDGTLVVGWPVLQGHVFGPLYSTPAAGDVDGDGDLEICFKIYGGNGFPADIHLLHHNGTPVAGWPKLGLDRSHLSSPVLADIDGDAALDVIVSLHYFNSGNYVRVYVWDSAGADVPGFPVVGSWNTAPENTAIGDLDGDGRHEILVSTSNYTVPYFAVHAWNHDGTPLSGSWPRSAPLCLVNSSPALADLDGGLNELVVGAGGCYLADNGVMNAWGSDGTPVATWPRSVSGWLRSSALVIDRDGDSTPEVYVGATDGWIHVFPAADATGGIAPEWNQIFHDTHNTNCRAVEKPASVSDQGVESVPGGFALRAAWPNPFSYGTTIHYDVPEGGGEIRLSIFSAAGRRVVDLAHGAQAGGRHTEFWNGLDAAGRRAAAGVYFVRLEASSYRETREVTLLR